MTAKQLKAVAESLGFGIAHVRAFSRGQRAGTMTAYVAVRNEDAPEIDELRWSPSRPRELQAFQHATKANGFTQFDKPVGVVSFDEATLSGFTA